MSHSRRARRALEALAEADPALAALSLWCTHVDGPTGPEAPRALTRGRTITYGPGFADLPAHEAQGLAAHHILHAALDHSARMAAMAERTGARFRPDLWTEAADAIVNEALIAAGQALPRPAVTLLPLLARLGVPGVDTRSALADWDVERLYLRMTQGGATARGATADLSGPDGGDGPREAEAGRPKQGGASAPETQAGRGAGTQAAAEQDLAPEPSAAQSPEAQAAFRGHLVRAMEAGRMAGRGLGILGLILADLPRPRTPWEVVLRGLVARALTLRPEAAPLRPSRRWLAEADAARQAGRTAPPFAPGQRQTARVARLVVGLDTSSSIDESLRAQFLAETGAIARRSGAELRLIPFDEAPEAAIPLPAGAPLPDLRRIPMRQGGGTDFEPLIAAAARHDPALLVVLTDLEGNFGPRPGFGVLWAVRRAPPEAPPFGQVLILAE